MMRLLCHIASLGDTAFETIIHAGYLDVLPLLSSHTSGAPMFDILDIPLQVIRSRLIGLALDLTPLLIKPF